MERNINTTVVDHDNPGFLIINHINININYFKMHDALPLARISSQHTTWSEFAKNGIMPIDIYGYVEIVKIIASFQENPNLTNTNGWTPIVFAVRFCSEIVL